MKIFTRNNTLRIQLSLFVFVVVILNTTIASAQSIFSTNIVMGAAQTDSYFPLLQGKKVALVGNQTSTVNGEHLADLMLANGVPLQFVFSPEHGFRGKADAGAKVSDGFDTKTGLSIVSLYGRHKKPTPEDLNDIEYVVFDIQDVGVRFYTYISTLHYIMEACAENNIPLLVLDRPNPNGFYVDGPTLQPEASSFVGMHQIPLVHGMTIGEYALMINEEYWLNDSIHCNLMVLPCKNYTHNTFYELPVKPSPNLPNIRSIYLYPSLGLFEGTVFSVGRGTPFPFQVYGHPDHRYGNFRFTPEPMFGAQHPKLNGKTCNGFDLRIPTLDSLRKIGFTLQYLIDAYKAMPQQSEFFNNFFYRLAGSHNLRQQIEKGLTEEEIKANWQTDIAKFKIIRKRYLLYPDFE